LTPGDRTPGEPEWKSRRQRGGRAGNLFFHVLARSGRLGLWASSFFLFWVAGYFVLFAPKGRRASFELAHRLGRGKTLAARVWFCFRQFYGFGRSMYDRMAILSGGAHLFRCDSHGREHLNAAREQGRGVLLLTAHLGNWEAMAQLLGGLGGRVTLVMYDGISPELRKTFERLAEGRSFRVLFTDGSPSSAAGILSALAEGDIVGLMGDRVQAGKGVRASLLGAEIKLPVGPYALAAASGAPLMHVFAVRVGSRRYAFHAFPAETLKFANRRDKDPDLERWAGAFANRMEEFLRKYPAQWANLYSIWSTTSGQ
jgi:predicted LPLAT superfamily acyltransferase